MKDGESEIDDLQRTVRTAGFKYSHELECRQAPRWMYAYRSRVNRKSYKPTLPKLKCLEGNDQ